MKNNIDSRIEQSGSMPIERLEAKVLDKEEWVKIAKRGIRHQIRTFLEKADNMRYSYELLNHHPVKDKEQLGYSPERIAITVAYGHNGNRIRTYFFVFIRDAIERSGSKLTKSFIRANTGLDDLESAAEQARSNLGNRMQEGAIAPYYLGHNDVIFVDFGNYLRSKENGGSVNFTGGSLNSSIAMQFYQAVDVWRRLFPGQVHLVDFQFNGTG